MSATLRLVENGHNLAEQRQASARWRRGLQKAAKSLFKASIGSYRPQGACQPSSVLLVTTALTGAPPWKDAMRVWPESNKQEDAFNRYLPSTAILSELQS